MKRHGFAVIATVLLVGLVQTQTLLAQGPSRDGYAVVDCRGLMLGERVGLTNDPRLQWWVELADVMLVRGSRSDLRTLAKELPMHLLPQPVDDRSLMVAGKPLPVAVHDARVVVEDRRFAIVDTRFKTEKPEGHPVAAAIGCHAEHDVLMPLVPNQRLGFRPPETRLAANKVAAIDDLVAQADVVRWYNDVFYLSCHNRWSASETIRDATFWLVDRFRQIPGLDVSLQRFDTLGYPADNVVAVLPGTESPDDWYIVGAHYDSISQSPNIAAPGAEDNASGTAAVLEMARLFAAHPPKSTIIFICFSGEEQGLFGSRFYAQELDIAGDAGKVRGMLNMDMISFSADETLDILLETAPEAEFLTDPFIRAAEAYTDLRVSVSLNPFGSDHVPFLQRGMPALLVIDADYSFYPGYHRTNDTPEKIVLEMGWDVLRMNLAALAEMAGIPGVPASPPGE